ncbi:cellulase family glycosylhydrolase [Saccharothrix luteola]|uniref:cellulase family glycosylhydrolase n=1 Tax=Saccharothrix luteola TaxID=2893018 RepID=UPI001E58011B|nr:cellulase family glycosylhydrolase [Saccharothrix luteola]MCC8243071.1 glycoside hydrolase family 5 protein [Saccharothrix luteola]
MRLVIPLAATLTMLAVAVVPAVAESTGLVVNDSDSTYFTYPSGTWGTTTDRPAKYNGDDHFTNAAGARAQLRFTGTQVILKGATAPHHGTATVTIDAGAPTTVSQQSALRQDNVPFFTSPVLPAGPHTVTITVTAPTFSLDSAELIGTPLPALPRITALGDNIQRNGQDWWFTGYNSAVWSGDCGRDDEKMTSAQVDAWFAGMRHDGHGAVRLFFFEGWDIAALDAAVTSARRHNVYLTITLDDAIAGCGETSKTPEWFGSPQERDAYRQHMVNLLERYRGETAIAWFEYFNEPGGDNTWRQVRDFYNAMGDIASGVDPDRLFSAGTLSPQAVGGEANYRALSGSRGVDIASVHEFDADAVISAHYDAAKANSVGKPLVVGEFGMSANATGEGCARSFAARAEQVSEKLDAYIEDSAGAFGWAWQPGGQPDACEMGNLDADTASQTHFRAASR